MKYDFRVRSDEICTEEGEGIIVYGVDVISEGTAVKTLKDVFCNRNDAEAFVRFCSDGRYRPKSLKTQQPMPLISSAAAVRHLSDSAVNAV